MNRAGRHPAVPLAALFAGTILLAACGTPAPDQSRNSSAQQPSAGTASLGQAPDFELTTLSGEPFRLQDQLGYVVVVNFWATWCGPCREEIPDFVQLQKELRSRGLRFVGISVDEDAEAEVRRFVDEYGINYPLAIDDGGVASAYRGNLVIPSTFLLDRHGSIRHRFIGTVSFDTMIPKLEALLAEAGPRVAG